MIQGLNELFHKNAILIEKAVREMRVSRWRAVLKVLDENKVDHEKYKIAYRGVSQVKTNEVLKRFKVLSKG